ncbi:MAG: diguanylate cyclase [Phycisphaeraceae bacterium]|nr:diguanylate cyclase [Phycisphaeraceae bacterium]
MALNAAHFDDQQPIVLVIDDSPDVHRLLRARLRHEQLELRAVTNGEEGIELARAIKPAMCLLDLDMPGMDGFQVLRTLKNDVATMDIPVIVLSAMVSAQDKVTAFDLGAVDYITKPFNLTELRVRVRSALRLHRLVQMLAQRAQIDDLTGLWNRAYFDRRWTEEVSKASRHQRPLSIAMLDVDHFKSINDTYGHPAGDAVLQGVARLIQRECRTEDVACRYGGEEFALIMPDTGPPDAHNLCERIRSSIAATIWSQHPERTVTISIGIAGHARAGEISPNAWLEHADRALYAAKRAGRNTIVTAGGEPRLAKAG